MILLVATILLMSLGGIVGAWAQSDTIAYSEPEDLILVVRVDQQVGLSSGILGILYNGVYYLPAMELAELFDFVVDYDSERKFMTGWYLDPKNTFSIDGNALVLTNKDVQESLSQEDILQDDLSPYPDELYVAVETLNRIWPLDMSIDIPSLALDVYPQEKLPFQQKMERAERREKLEAKSLYKDIPDDLPIIRNPYKMIDRPSIDIQSEATFEGGDNRYNTTISGVQDLLGTTADFGAAIRREEGEFKRPDNVRLRLRKIALGEESYMLGIKQYEGGDIRLAQRDLVGNAASGRGVSVTTTPFQQQGEFDVVAIEGVAPAGWEIELYRNAELIDFGTVPDDGLYRFEDVQLLFGNNEIRAILYGPEGQVREDVYNYNFNRSMVEPGKTEFSAGIVDTNEDFIPIEIEQDIRAEGISATGYVFRGINKNITLFGGASQLAVQQLDEEQKYLSTGVAYTTPIGSGQIEAYKQSDAGEAIDTRFLTSFKKININLRGAKFNDFQSPDAGFGTSAKDYEGEIELQRNIRLPVGSIGLRAEAEYTKNVDDRSSLRYTTQESYTWRGLRLSNRTTTQIQDSEHTSTSGRIDANYRLRKWRFRPSLNYEWFPTGRITGVDGEVRYQIVNDYSVSFNASHQFDSALTNLRLGFSKEFEEFIGTVEGQWDSEDGMSMMVRASTSLGPYGKKRDYIVSREKLSTLSPVQARVFLDKNLDGNYDEGEDQPIEEARVAIGTRRTPDSTDENGLITMLQSLAYENTPIRIDEGSIDDPYYRPANKGYFIQPRPGSMPYIELPLVETGAIDGTVFYDETGKEVEGLTLQLVNETGEIIQTTQTAYDGFYTFEFVPPGKYIVRADPALNVDIDPVEVSVAGEELLVSGIDMPLNSVSPQGGDSDQSPFVYFGPYKPDEPKQEPEKQMFGPFRQGNDDEDDEPQAQPLVKDRPREKFGPEKPKSTGSTGLPPPSPDDGVYSGTVQRVRIGEHPSKVRMVLDLSGPVDFTSTQSSDGKMITIDMPDVAWDAIRQWNGAHTPVMSSFTVEALAGGGSRLILNARDAMTLQASGLLPPHDGFGYRIYLDVVPY